MGLEVTDDHFCYVCGKDNPAGFRLDFEHPKPGILRAMVIFRKEHQGYKNIVHGGMIGMLLDEVMLNLVWKENKPSLTGEITVRLKKMIKIGEKVFLEGRMDRENGKLIYTSATAKNEKGALLATATAACVRIQKVG